MKKLALLILLALCFGCFARSVRVTWNPPSVVESPDVIAYTVYMGTNSGVYFTNWVVLGRDTTQLVVNVNQRGTYYFTACSMSSSNLLSDYANEAVAPIPGPPGNVNIK